MHRVRCPRCRKVLEITREGDTAVACPTCSIKVRIPANGRQTEPARAGENGKSSGESSESVRSKASPTDVTLRLNEEPSPSHRTCPQCRITMKGPDTQGVYECPGCGRRGRLNSVSDKPAPPSKVGRAGKPSRRSGSKKRAGAKSRRSIVGEPAILDGPEPALASPPPASRDPGSGKREPLTPNQKSTSIPAPAKSSAPAAPAGHARMGPARSPFGGGMSDTFVDKMQELNRGDEMLVPGREPKPGGLSGGVIALILLAGVGIGLGIAGIVILLR